MTKQPKMTIPQKAGRLDETQDDMLHAMETLAVAFRSQSDQIAALEAVVIALVRSGGTDGAGLRRAFDEAKDATDPVFHPGLGLALQKFLSRLDAGRKG